MLVPVFKKTQSNLIDHKSYLLDFDSIVRVLIVCRNLVNFFINVKFYFLDKIRNLIILVKGDYYGY